MKKLKLVLAILVIFVSAEGATTRRESPDSAFSFLLNGHNTDEVRQFATEFARSQGLKLHATADDVPAYEGERFLILDFRRAGGMDFAIARLPKKNCVTIGIYKRASTEKIELFRDQLVAFMQQLLRNVIVDLQSNDCSKVSREPNGSS